MAFKPLKECLEKKWSFSEVARSTKSMKKFKRALHPVYFLALLHWKAGHDDMEKKQDLLKLRDEILKSKGCDPLLLPDEEVM
jgi:hypothetical protein